MTDLRLGVCVYVSFLLFQIRTFVNEHYFKEDKIYVRPYLSKNESFLSDVLTFSHEGIVNAHVVLAVRSCCGVTAHGFYFTVQ